MKILHLDSSVTGANSVSRPLTQFAVDRLLGLNPGASHIYRDLTLKPLRHYTAVLRAAQPPTDLSDAQREELRTGEEILDEFLACEQVVVGAPMYNFSIPSQLKAWVDLICVAGKTFRYTASGPQGLCEGKKVVVISTRGGLYGPGSPFEPRDHQEKYLRDVFAFLGVVDVQVVTAEGVAYGEDRAAEAIAQARKQLESLTF